MYFTHIKITFNCFTDTIFQFLVYAFGMELGCTYSLTLAATRRQRSANWQSGDNGSGKTCEAVRAGFKIFFKMDKIFKVENAVAILGCGAVEAETISKTRASSKSHTSRGNLLRMSVLLCVIFCVSVGAWGQGFIIESKLKDKDKITISIDLTSKALFVIIGEGSEFKIGIERMRTIDIGEKGSGRKRVDLYLEDWKIGENKGTMRYFMVTPEKVYWSSDDMILGALEIPIENIKDFNINALVNAVAASKNGTITNAPTASIGQQVQIINSGKTYSSINDGNCLTWPNDDIKSKAGSWEWGEYNFEPQIGMKGKIVGITKHCSTEKVIYILLINNKFYVPIGADGVRFL